MKEIGGFDTVAAFYDMLAAIVFGRSIRKAQRCFLNNIQKSDKILILGGGTGWILVHLLEVNPACEICYVDSSSAMIAKAKANAGTIGNARVHFIHGTQDQLPMHVTYDAVIVNFYFDLFSTASLALILKQIRSVISPNGKLLVSDFVRNNNWWQSVLLEGMYQFFRLLCDIEAVNLPDWQRQLLACRFELKTSKYFYRNFIRSAVYEIGNEL